MDDDWNEMWRQYYVDEQAYGQVLYQRAIGELPEKLAHAAFGHLLKDRFYQPGESVLDIGCAAGHLLRSLRTHTDPLIAYSGVDFNPFYIELAKKAFGDSAQFVQGDAFALPFPDKHFDHALVNLFHHFPDIEPALAECRRIARKWCIWRTPMAPVTHMVKAMQSELKGGEKYYYFNLFSEQHIRGVLGDLGVSQVEFLPDSNKGEYSNHGIFGATASRSEGGREIVGNLLVDWTFVCFPTS